MRIFLINRHMYHRTCLEHVCSRFDNTKEGEKVHLRCIRCESGETHEENAQTTEDPINFLFEYQEDTESD